MSSPLPADAIAWTRDAFLPALRNDIVTVAEAHCSDHGSPGAGAAFTAGLICCVSCEVLADLTAPPRVQRSADRRRDFYRRLGDVAKDPRYGALGELVHRTFRDGIAHTFLPKLIGDVSTGTFWFNGPLRDGQFTSLCLHEIAEPQSLLATRMNRHLQLNLSSNPKTFVILPQVFSLDVLAFIDLLRSDLSIAGPYVQVVRRNFRRWWQNHTTIKKPLDPDEQAYVTGARRVPTLLVTPYWRLRNTFGGDIVESRLERSSGGWDVVEVSAEGESRSTLKQAHEADEAAVERRKQLRRCGYFDA